MSTPNRLIREKSPYLLEHAHNPVDWYPWADEAFEKAVREDKPIFLSIGYSSCHWCHVFRRESLEDPDIAKILNDNFVSIKVDREEKPEVDEIYMKAVMSMTGSGGWPLNVFLTPSLEPFYGGTYFPPTSREGMPGFAHILNSVAKSWRTDRKNLVGSASEIRRSINNLYNLEQQIAANDVVLDSSIYDQCFNELAEIYDATYGGFGSAPKFPSSSNLSFLLRYYMNTQSKAPLLMVKKTLDNLSMGGIYDHIGGGFHRYSTDREWLVPHFEKMLYDNALLAALYTETYLLTKADSYGMIVKETLSWVLREMTNENGGFFSSVDADTPEGEGVFYLWSGDDVIHALSNSRGREQFEKLSIEKRARIVGQYFGISEGRNSPEGEKSILTSSEDRVKLISKEYSLSEPEIKAIVEDSKERMREFRWKSRTRPAIDDKILVSWNGLMISAMSKAFQAFGTSEFLYAAKRSAEFILNNLFVKKDEDDNFRIIHRFRDGDASGEGNLEDYAYFLNGLLDLYESDFNSIYLRRAKETADSAIEQFYDDSGGGFYLTSENSKHLIARPKEAFDGAIPSANSVMVHALFRLAELLQDEIYAQKAMDTIRAFSRKIERQPSAFVYLLVALYFHDSPPKEIVISGQRNSEDFSQMLAVLRSFYMPDSVLLFAEESVRNLSPLSEGRISNGVERAKVFICKGNTCDLPANNTNELFERLKLTKQEK